MPGKHFVVGFLENRIIMDYPVAHIYVTSFSREVADVTISVPTVTGHVGHDVVVRLDPLKGRLVELPHELHMSGTAIEYKGKSNGVIIMHGSHLGSI